ncbi:hypothetical protein IC006_0810 [Sulfuracidifex tepidarius]|uniref:Uncharacterized protein n=2 Tax=Sulfuracidifex tepidarius TaxID=1294262 RepID=A0A510E2F1_9CREN|nr:hypothetical protein [Sulfuracidifex tepidarius]BBG23526.1 hypothetical protein IC006_0810 [Sulfuracidifex tepidarius]BBG26280.1 hypothetical protein IC007_0785 [Sulfuracidifex tepidarius]
MNERVIYNLDMKLQGYNITSIMTPETYFVVSQPDLVEGRELPSFVSMDCNMNEIRRITFSERKKSFYPFYKYSVEVHGIGRMESMKGLERIEVKVNKRSIEMTGEKRRDNAKVIFSILDVPTLTWSENDITSFLREQFGVRLKRKGERTYLIENLNYVNDKVNVKVIDVDSWPLPLSQLSSNLAGNLL